MQTRTLLRTILDLFLNNAIARTVASIVNFCNEQRYYNRKELKFLKKMPINNIAQDKYYKNRFVFNSLTTKRIDSK